MKREEYVKCEKCLRQYTIIHNTKSHKHVWPQYCPYCGSQALLISTMNDNNRKH